MYISKSSEIMFFFAFFCFVFLVFLVLFFLVFLVLVFLVSDDDRINCDDALRRIGYLMDSWMNRCAFRTQAWFYFPVTHICTAVAIHDKFPCGRMWSGWKSYFWWGLWSDQLHETWQGWKSRRGVCTSTIPTISIIIIATTTTTTTMYTMANATTLDS